jgi:hypothetical protein
MIHTKKFELSKKEYLSIILRVLIRKKWWLFALMWIIAAFQFFKDEKDELEIFIMIFTFLFPFIMFFEYWRFANSKQNNLIFIERHHEIFADKIITYLGTGSESTIVIENFIKTFELADVYLLYISKNSSVIFPKRIFQTSEDENWFRQNVFLKIKNK